MVNIEIDGIKIQARDGAMVIEAADEAGIHIPRFCYHKKLSVAANCRMCLVDVEKAGKPLPACATPITDGMRVFTKSAKALDAQKGVMEFLLINHPLDCPICDQGGECELQDLAMGYGGSHSRFQEKKRVVPDKNLGPLISTDMTRCIHCTRCVRFGEEIAGIKELGATGRGEHMEIGTYVERAVTSEMSGNVIDLCPVGALTSKPFRYNARAWELTNRPAIAAHDCLGSNIIVQTKGKQVRRVLPRENEQINETWLADRDRFAYEGLNSADRLTTPRIKRDGQWEDVAWDAALEFAVQGLKRVVTRHGAGQLGALLAPASTVEEVYLLQKLMRGMGTANVDHRLRQRDFSDQDIAPVFPWLGMPIAELESLQSVLMVGANLRKDQPIANHRIRKAVLAGGVAMTINPADYGFNYPVGQQILDDAAAMPQHLAAVLKAALQQKSIRASGDLDKLVASVAADKRHEAVAKQLQQGRAAILLGVGACGHPRFASLRALAIRLSDVTGARLGYLTLGPNSAGAWLAGGVPHRSPGAKGMSYGLNAGAMLAGGVKGYVLLHTEPEQDCWDGAAAAKALHSADFVMSLSSYFSEQMAEYAQVVLPVGPFSETSGTFVNVEGRWQSFAAACEPLGETRPAWKVLRVLGNLLGVGGFDHMSSEQVRDEVRGLIGEVTLNNAGEVRCPGDLSAIADAVDIDVPMYQVDAVVRRAAALQAADKIAGARTQDVAAAAVKEAV
jgi:NADH-quinone oxidoreductase subunit G